jgi:predicted molibdopterin-dependent oxidoreductase YjgC
LTLVISSIKDYDIGSFQKATTGEQVSMIRLTIDGKEIEVQPGTTVLRAAEKAGITIPTLCAHPDLTPTGGCRMCLVEVKGARLPLSSCTLEATPGMVVETTTPPIIAHVTYAIKQLIFMSYITILTQIPHYNNSTCRV